MFKKKESHKQDSELIKQAIKYKKILEKAKVLPPNSKEMFKTIRKAGI